MNKQAARYYREEPAKRTFRLTTADRIDIAIREAVAKNPLTIVSFENNLICLKDFCSVLRSV